MLKTAKAICEDLPQADTFNLLSDIYHGLGAWANETNHGQECLNYTSQNLEMRRQALAAGAKADMRTATAWNQFGTGCIMVKDYEQAKSAFKKSIETFHSLDAAPPCSDSLPIVNLAVAEWLCGNLETASRLLEDGLLAREEEFGFMDQTSFR